MDRSLPFSSPSHDRARGALVGLAVGDAVGTTLEFQSPGSFRPIDDLVGGGPFGLEPGEWTDDTSMALCLAESLLDRDGHDPSDQLRRYVRWWKEGLFSVKGHCFDIGTTTRIQLARFLRTGQPHDPTIDDDQAANGSLMRLSPVAIRFGVADGQGLDTVIGMAAASSRTTHPADRPVDACKVLGAMTAALIRGQAPDEVLSERFWNHGPLHPAVEGVVRGSWKKKSPPAIRGTGYCIDALEAALWAVAGADDYSSAVLRAANLGDDADTTAAIAGQLAGARFGASAIPAAWINRLAMRTRIESLADGLFTRASSQPLPWAFDPSFHAWWVEPGRILAGEYPGSPRAEDARLKLSLLADAGIRTIVDLTTPNDALAPYADAWIALGTERGLTLRHLHHPIPDLSITSPERYRQILDGIEAEQGAGRGVFIHCWGGVGRTGTVVGLRLAEGGITPAEALARIATLRAGTRKAGRPAPETAEQRAVVLSGAPPRGP